MPQYPRHRYPTARRCQQPYSFTAMPNTVGVDLDHHPATVRKAPVAHSTVVPVHHGRVELYPRAEPQFQTVVGGFKIPNRLVGHRSASWG